MASEYFEPEMESVLVVGSIDLIFFCIFYMKYSKLVLGLSKISYRTGKDSFLEADLINYHYIEAKPVSRNFFRPVSSLICSFSSIE